MGSRLFGLKSNSSNLIVFKFCLKDVVQAAGVDLLMIREWI